MRSDLCGVDFLILQGLKSAKYSPKFEGNVIHNFTYYLGEYLTTKKEVSQSTKDASDENRPNTKRNHANDQLEVPIRPITRARAKKFKEALNGLVNGLRIDLAGSECDQKEWIEDGSFVGGDESVDEKAICA